MNSLWLDGLSSGWWLDTLWGGPDSLLAYLDQGSGSYILQTFATGLFSVGYFARRVWKTLTSPWRRKDG